MPFNLIDIPTLIREHDFVRAGIKVVEDNYREYQYSYREWGPGRHETEVAERGYRGALEVLERQIAELPGLDRDDVKISLKAHIMNRCGWPKDPRGFDEWNADGPPGYATLR